MTQLPLSVLQHLCRKLIVSLQISLLQIEHLTLTAVKSVVGGTDTQVGDEVVVFLVRALTQLTLILAIHRDCWEVVCR